MRQTVARLCHFLGVGLFVIAEDYRSRVESLLRMTAPPPQTHNLVRRGPQGDGGYFVPELEIPFDYVFSPGVGGEMGFDMEFANAGVPVFQIDGSIAAPPEEHRKIEFKSLFLKPVSIGDGITLEDWVTECAPDMKFGLLQLDVEGAEYEAILSSSKSLLGRFASIIIELHSLERIGAPLSGDMILSTLAKLLESHAVVFRSVNNNGEWFRRGGIEHPSTIEVTYIRKDLFVPSMPLMTVPSFRNVSSKPARQLD
jgi:hypothetical protein